MSTTPTREDVPNWASDSTFDALGDDYDGDATKATPTSGAITQGVRPGRRSPAQYFNWLMNRVTAILQWFADRADSGFPHAVRKGDLAAMRAIEDPNDGDLFIVQTPGEFEGDFRRGELYYWDPTRFVLDSEGEDDPREYVGDASIAGGEVPNTGLLGAWTLVRTGMERVFYARAVSTTTTTVGLGPGYTDVRKTAAPTLMTITIPLVREGDIIEVRASEQHDGDRESFFRAVYNDGSDHAMEAGPMVLPRINSDGTHSRSACVIASWQATGNRVNATVRLQASYSTSAGGSSGITASNAAMVVEVTRQL